jgi:hypothetical protein
MLMIQGQRSLRTKYLDRHSCLVFPGSAGVSPASDAARMAALPGYKGAEHHGIHMMSEYLSSFHVYATTCRRLEHERVGRSAIACYILRAHTKGRVGLGIRMVIDGSIHGTVRAATRPWLWQNVLAWQGHSGGKKHEGL